MKQTAHNILGTPPWTDEQLTHAYFTDFVGIHRSLHKHPGYRLHAELETLELSMRLFGLAVDSLRDAIEAFHDHSRDRSFRSRVTAEETDATILAVQAVIFQAVTTASAYKGRAQTLGKRISVPEFQKRFAATFTDSDSHHFVQELRDHLSHVAPFSAEWELSRPSRHGPEIARFLMFVDDLTDVATQGQRWRPAAVRFIQSRHRAAHDRGGEIDVATLFDDYAGQLREFHIWLVGAAEPAAGTPLAEYRDVERRFHRIATRVGWNAWIIPALKQTQNPRALLDTRLTPAEIACLDALPAGSPEQVNQLIEFIDDAEYGFVDSEIRQAIFDAFGASGS